jgi:hypothetical protein
MIAYIVGNRAGMSSFDAEFLEPECAAGREFRMSAENSFVNHSRPARGGYRASLVIVSSRAACQSSDVKTFLLRISVRIVAISITSGRINSATASTMRSLTSVFSTIFLLRTFSDLLRTIVE